MDGAEVALPWKHRRGSTPMDKKTLNMEFFQSPDDEIPSKTLSYVNIRV
jgi:hypothetical protein